MGISCGEREMRITNLHLDTSTNGHNRRRDDWRRDDWRRDDWRRDDWRRDDWKHGDCGCTMVSNCTKYEEREFHAEREKCALPICTSTHRQMVIIAGATTGGATTGGATTGGATTGGATTGSTGTAAVRW